MPTQKLRQQYNIHVQQVIIKTTNFIHAAIPELLLLIVKSQRKDNTDSETHENPDAGVD